MKINKTKYSIISMLVILDSILLFEYSSILEVNHFLTNPPVANVPEIFLLLRSCEQHPIEDNLATSSRFRCYQRVLADSVKTYGLIETSRSFDYYIETDQTMILAGGACHALGHDIGQAAITAGYSGAKILTHCSRACEGGCFNGVGHTYLSLGRGANEIDAFCNPPEYRGSRERVLACYHGFGHGITDTFGVNLKENLQRCDAIKDKDGRFECGHAVFMTFSTLPMGIELSGVPANLPDFCAQVDHVYQFSCSIFTGYLTYGKAKDVTEAFYACGRVPGEYRRECFERIGESVFIDHADNPSLVRENCAYADTEELSGLCMTGAAKTSIVNVGSRPEVGFTICSGTPISFRPYCYQSLGEQVERVRGPQERTRLCLSLAGSFSNACFGRVQELQGYNQRLF